MKMIHCADIHLDAPFSAFDPVEAQKRRSALRSVFSSLTLYAKTNNVQLCLIAGDLFDDESVTKDTLMLLTKEMASADQCRFVIAPGNHDPYSNSSPYKLVKWPDNVYIFDSEKVKSFDFPEINTTVYGYAFTSETYSSNPFENFSVKDKSRVNIMCAHCDLGVSGSTYAPVTAHDFEISGLDYVAMGHIHKATEILSAGNTIYAYSGCLQGRSFDETGHKGAIVGEITKEQKNLKHIRFSSKHYECVECDVSGMQTFDEALEKISQICRSYDTDTMLRIILTGVTGTMFLADVKAVAEVCTNVGYIELKDKTLALLDAEKLSQDKTLAGEFYRKLEPQLKSDDPEQVHIASMALKYGLMALGGMEITL